MAKYSNFKNMFLKKLAIKLSKYSSIDINTINLEKNQKPLYRPIYSLKIVELEIFKTYININLVNAFVWLYKSFVKTLILFIKKLNSSFCLYINY